MHFDLKRATCSDPKPAGFTSDVSHPAALSADRGMIFCFGCWVKRVVSSMRRLFCINASNPQLWLRTQPIPRNLESFFFFRIDPDVFYFDLTLFHPAPTSVT
jgi:hypothetical protein